MADPGAFLRAGDPNAQTGLPEWLARMLAPNMTGLLSGQPDPNQLSSQPLPQYGKVPSTEDPRNDRAISEALMLGGSMMPAGRAAMGLEGASRFIPEGMQSAPGFSVPGPAGPVMAATLGLTAPGAEAGDTAVPEFKWSDPNSDRVARLRTIDTEIAKEASRKTPSAPGTQAKRIDSLDAEKKTLLGQQDADYNAAREQWSTSLEDARKAAVADKWAKTSVFDMVPGTRGALIAGTWPASYYGGKYMGTRFPLGQAVARGAAVGGLKGFLTANGPSDIDRFGLPEGAPARDAASANFSDPKYWAAVGSNTALDAALGAAGAVMGNSSRRSTLPKGPGPAPLPPSPSPMPPTLGASGGTPPAPPQLSPQPSISGPSRAPILDKNLNRWRDPITGNFAKKPKTLGLDD